MSDLELSISKLVIDLKEDSSLRDHLIEIYQKVGFGLLKRQFQYDELLARHESEWRATCDRLIEDHQAIKDEKETIEEEARIKIQRLESQLNELKAEHYQLTRQNKEQSEKLTKEVENTIKTHYIKNVILSYLTTDDNSVR